jgi:hypothetical protein
VALSWWAARPPEAPPSRTITCSMRVPSSRFACANDRRASKLRLPGHCEATGAHLIDESSIPRVSRASKAVTPLMRQAVPT